MSRNLRRLPSAGLLLAAMAGSLAAPGETQAWQLRAGAGVARIAAPAGVPLAGYGARGPGNSSRGTLAPVQARALVVESGELRVGVVALDVLVVWPTLRAAVATGVADLELDALVVAATHTHSGPGGYVDQWLAELGVMGWHHSEAGRAIASAAHQALRDAQAGRVPARMGASLADAAGLAVNRRREAGPRATQVPVLRVDDLEGRPLATLFALGAHPVVLSPKNDSLSPDYPGAARARVEERRGGVALFLAGPLGDQNPSPPGVRLWGEDPSIPVPVQAESAYALGVLLGDRVVEAAAGTPTDPSAPVAVRGLVWSLPRVDVRVRCAGYVLGPILHRAASRSLSRKATLLALRLGELRILASPFELGVEVADAIRQRSPGPLLVATHANDWLGYLLMPEDHARGGYETCLSFHGTQLAPRFVDQALRALAPLADPPVGASASRQARGPRAGSDGSRPPEPQGSLTPARCDRTPPCGAGSR